jgi:hypothetical protein
MSYVTPLPTTLADLHDYRQPLVRDMAWALRASPLLAPRSNDVQWLGPGWCERAWRDYRPRLEALDADPAALQTHLAGQRDKRLGSHFESLLAFWLADPANSLYRLVASHIPIRDGNRTLGELDFLVQDKASGRFQHWEVAVKFYLGVKAGGDYHHWVGPGLGDRLDLKVSHLLQHQLSLTGHPAARAALETLGVSHCTSACLLKGRLFYPLDVEQLAWQPMAACPRHETGWWLPAGDFPARFDAAALDWLPLPREHWLTPLVAGSGSGVSIGDTSSAADLLERMTPDFDNRAIAVVGLRDGQEVTRGFVTPFGWPGITDKKSPS